MIKALHRQMLKWIKHYTVLNQV